MRLPRIVLIVGGAIMVLVGLLYFVRPESLSPGSGPGLELHDAPARTEIRAVYGGIELALGVFFLICARRRELFAPGLIMAALMGLLAGAGRLVGWLVEGELDTLQVLWMSLEVAGGLVAAYAWRRLDQLTDG